MTEISKDRIERAARQMARTAYRMDQDAAGKPCAESEEEAAADHFWRDFERTAEAALIADAPALLAVRALLVRAGEAMNAHLLMCDSVKPRKLDDALTWRQNDERVWEMIQSVLADIARATQADAAQLSSEGEGT